MHSYLSCASMYNEAIDDPQRVWPSAVSPTLDAAARICSPGTSYIAHEASSPEAIFTNIKIQLIRDDTSQVMTY